MTGVIVVVRIACSFKTPDPFVRLLHEKSRRWARRQLEWSLMTEEAVVRNTEQPRTVASLSADLRALGLREGMSVLVHSSMSSLGWVVGGTQSIIQALTDTLGESGTLVMPAFCCNSDPRDWQNPPIPESWWQVVRDDMPAFDPRQTPTWRLGQIPEAFRSWPGVKRSAHPALSFCAWGKHSDTVTRNHELHNSHGEGSPLARLYELNAHVLLEGVGHDRNTSLHLAEYRAEWPSKHVVDQGAAMFIDGQRTWATYHEVLFAPADFPRIGAAFEATGACGTGKIGNAPAKLMSQVALIDFASDWIHAHRR